MNDEFANIPSIEPGVYEHYKGNRYEVIGVGAHTETLEHFVVYKALYSKPGRQPDLWMRPYDMFMETVIVSGEVQPRFRKVTL